MRKIYILVLLLVAFGASSCNDWLDVRPETEQKEDDQFSTYKGVCSAMTGLYMLMGDQDIYGKRLTMTNIESLANLWYIDEGRTNRYEDSYLKEHDYSNVTYSQAAIKAIYAKLFNTIVQANVIIKHLNEHGDVISDPAIRATLQGEAYGVRAYLQLDVLRLFGQVPGGSQQVSLPYCETTNIDEMPAYYTFDQYVEKLKQDIEMAESLLNDNDPLFQYSFTELNSSYNAPVDDYMLFRQSRMNYWAVKALEARMYRYLGDDSMAYQKAKEIIDATLNGEPVMTMSGTRDFNAGYKLCPNECLFYLSKYDVMDYSQDFLVGGSSNKFSNSSNYGLTQDMLTELYSGILTESHNRYINWWNGMNGNVTDESGRPRVVTMKYYWDADNVTNAMLYYQLIPMLRMSEIYLIAMESTTDLNEANNLYHTYMLEHNVPNLPDFTSKEELQDFIVYEYRREFFAEGQMFYTYKRLNSTSMLWCDEPINEDDYILPLPTTEYNPNK